MKRILSGTALLSAVAGFAGGFVAQEFVSPVRAYGQAIVPGPSRPEWRPAATELDAQRFVLVDATGRVNAEIKMKDGEPEIVLYDKDGRVGWRAVPNAFGIHPVEVSK